MLRPRYKPLPTTNGSLEKNKTEKSGIINDFFNAEEENPYHSIIDKKLWHSSYGRSAVLGVMIMLTSVKASIEYSAGLSLYKYGEYELSLTDYKSKGYMIQLIVWLSLLLGISYMTAAITPYVNRNMGGDYHNIYDPAAARKTATFNMMHKATS